MGYYDRWDDRNRDAHRQGEKDAQWGYRSRRFDYDSHTERGAAYDDGYQEERRRLDRIEAERREQEEAERRRLDRQIREQEREWERQREANRQMEQQENEESGS